MSEVIPVPAEGTLPPSQPPSRISELLSLGKLIFGIALIALGCWRAYVFAFGADESLFFASKISATQAIEESKALQKYAKSVRDLKQNKQTEEEWAQELDRLERELKQSLNDQPQKVQKGYRVQRWMELLLVLISFTFGPGFIRAGKNGIRWPKKSQSIKNP